MINNQLNSESLKEVVAVFKTISDMDAAIDKLTTSGFNPSEISMLADQKKIDKNVGQNKSVEELMDNPDAPRIGYIANENVGAAQGGLIGGLAYVGSLAAAGTVIAVGGPVSAVFATAAIAGGTFASIGTVLGKLIGNHHAERMETQLANGGIIVWVKINDDEHEKLALDILKEFNAEHLHTHTLEYQANNKESFLAE